MPELPPDFDLKLMPDWLKEPASKNPYADYEVRDEDRRGRGRGGEGWGGGSGGGRGPKPGGGPRGAGGGRNDRGPNRGGDARGRKPGGPGARRPEGGPPRRDDTERDRRDFRERGPAPAQPPANVAIEFFPDEHAAASIAREIKSTHRAYSLLDLARMFLAKPERHRVKITTKTVAEPLYQVGENGPVTFDKASAERAAFPAARAAYYVEETVQREPPKGNFTNVARCRANGQLLGPTSYHGYQPALRKLYEERFSRRMSFAEFQRDIEVVNDPALVEQWKEQTRSSTIYRLKPPEPVLEETAPVQAPAAAESAAEAEPVVAEAAEPMENTEDTLTPELPAEPVEPAPSETGEPMAADTPVPLAPETPSFSNLNEVEQHFREHYLPGMIRVASSFQLSGEASRAISDRGIATAVRQAWEQERGFPGQVMHQLRQQFTRAGLQVFKHRKRMQFVSLIRPSPMEGGSLSPSVAEILRVIQNDARCTRASLAAAILGADETAVDAARKATLASDLRWLIDTGRVIEFSDGHLDLPLAPPKNEPVAKPAETAAVTAAPAEAATPAEPEQNPSETVEVAASAEAEATPAIPETVSEAE